MKKGGRSSKRPFAGPSTGLCLGDSALLHPLGKGSVEGEAQGLLSRRAHGAVESFCLHQCSSACSSLRAFLHPT